MPAHFPDDGLATKHFNLDSHLISGNDRPAKLGFINTHKVNQRVLQILVRISRGEQPENGARLRHAFNGQHSRHDRRTWEMTIEKRLVDADVLDGNKPLVQVDLENSVDQEKRISMRKNPHDLGDSEFVHYFLAGSAGFGSGAFGVAAAGAAAGFPGVASTRRMISVVMSATS